MRVTQTEVTYVRGEDTACPERLTILKHYDEENKLVSTEISTQTGWTLKTPQERDEFHAVVCRG